MDSIIPPWQDSELLAALESLPSKNTGAPRFPWTPELDAALVKFWPVKNHKDVAKLIGCNATTAIERYRELTKDRP